MPTDKEIKRAFENNEILKEAINIVYKGDTSSHIIIGKRGEKKKFKAVFDEVIRITKQKTRQEDIHKLTLLKAKCESKGFNEGETLGFKRGVDWSIGVLEELKPKWKFKKAKDYEDRLG